MKTMAAPVKMPFDEVRRRMHPFLDFPDVEEDVQKEVREVVEKALPDNMQSGNVPDAEVLAAYLQSHTEQRLKILIGFSHGSLEKLKRVYMAIFPERGWSEQQIQRDEDTRRVIASFLLDPRSREEFIPPFIRDSFCLPKNWRELLTDGHYLHSVAQNIVKSKYSVSIGNALEESVRRVVRECGLEQQKGQVEVVDNKEVDVAVPNTSRPRFLIMSSYQLTTSSSQSSKANEQMRMYGSVQEYNRSRRKGNQPKIVFINVVDGGGWLSRLKDLRVLWESCDYCFPCSCLSSLAEVFDHHQNGKRSK